MAKKCNLKMLTLIIILSVGLIFPHTISRAKETDTNTTENYNDGSIGLSSDEDVSVPTGYLSEGENVIIDNAETVEAGGACGNTVTWDLTGGVLTISGTGDMQDFSNYSDSGWYKDRKSIGTIIVSEGITSLGDYAFYGCSNVKEVKLPSTLNDLGRISFAQCSSLKKIDIPDLVTVIPYAAFAECTSLNEVNAKNIEAIHDYAFQMIKTESFTIGKNITNISYIAFFHSTIKEYIVEAGNTVYSSKDGILYSDGGKTLYLYPAGREDSKFVIPSNVTKVYGGAFSYATNLKEIDLANVTSLGDSAFQASGIETLVLPDTVTEVGYFTFYQCKSLVSIKFGSGLKVTSYEMFEECTSLKNIDFGTGLVNLEARTFGYCSALEEVTIPDTITSIGNGCFGECSSLNTVTTKNLDSVPYQAFLNCDNLVNVYLNEGVKKLYRLAFYGCPKLKSVVLPSTVEYVSSIAFPADTKITNKNPLLDPIGKNGYRLLEPVNITGTRNYSFAYEVLDIVNQERKNNGLEPLVINEYLMEAAMVRAAETTILFAHVRPNSTNCFSASSLMSGENIAYGDATPKSVMESWMNSEGHRNNILTADFKTIGIGCFEINGRLYWVQCFGTGSETGDTTKIANKTVTEEIDIAVGTFSEEVEHGSIIWGNTDEYTFRLVIETSSKISAGTTETAKAYIVNPGNNAKTLINNDCLSWSSADTSIATVKAGVINCIKENQVSISSQTKDGGFKVSMFINTKDTPTGNPGSSDLTDPTNPANPNYNLQVPNLTYRTHVQTIGWQDWRSNGQMSGTSGMAKRLEGIEIKVDSDTLGIRYKTHVQSYGWQDWKCDGAMSGTHGQAKRLEAICIELTGPDKNKYDIYYRVHAQTYGWLGWAKNGKQAGTAGQGKRLEGIEIRIVPKGMVPSGLQGYSFVELGKTAKNASDAGIVNYMTHVQSYGNQSYVYDGSVSGTSGEAKRLEGIRININNELSGVAGGITYQTHVQSYGWLDWTSDGEFNGTQGKAKRLEAIRIKLTGDMEDNYDVYYRVHSQTFGWLGWAKNGEAAGTEGYAKRLEGIQIVVLPKGSAAPTAPGSQITPYIKK